MIKKVESKEFDCVQPKKEAQQRIHEKTEGMTWCFVDLVVQRFRPHPPLPFSHRAKGEPQVPSPRGRGDLGVRFLLLHHSNKPLA